MVDAPDPLAPPARRMSWPVQYAAGFAVGLGLPALHLATLRLGLGGDGWWVVVFFVVWITIFLSLRRRWRGTIVGLIIGLVLGYGLHLLFGLTFGVIS